MNHLKQTIFVSPKFTIAMAEKFGVDIGELKRVSGWENEDLERQYIEVELNHQVEITKLVAENMPCQNGLAKILDLAPHSAHQIEFLSTSLCENGASALAHIVKYGQVFMVESPQLITDEDGVTLQIGTVSLSPNLLKMGASRMLFCLEAMRRALGASLNPIAATFNFDIETEPLLTGFLEVHPTQALHMSLKFLHEDLQRPFSNFDSDLYLGVCSELDRCLDVEGQNIRIAQALYDVIQSQFGHWPPKISTSAAKLGLSQRSLQRRLKFEQTCFASVLDKARCDNVVNLLSREQMTKSQIAFHIGLRDTNSLYRLMRKWRLADQ